MLGCGYQRYHTDKSAYMNGQCISLAATKQLNEHFYSSVCLSITPFLTMFLSSYHHEISGVITIDKSNDHVNGQRSKVKVATNFVPIWAFPDCNSSLNSQRTKWCMKLEVAKKRCPIDFRDNQISRSHGRKINDFDPNWAFPDCNSSLNSLMATK